MTLFNLFTQQVMVSRLVGVSGGKTVYSTITAEYVNIQRMSEEKTARIGGAIGKIFRMYAEENADIQVGDRLVDTDTGDKYRVQAITIPAELGAFIHKEAMIIRVE